MTVSYYWTVGMEHPYWFTTDEIVGNQTADETGDLTPDKFKQWFPHAMPISKKQYEERSVTLAKYMRWRRKRS